MAEIPNGVVLKPMPKMIEPLSWLMGTWRCENEGHGQYPTIKSFQYGEELCFSNVGQPMLNYSSMSWHPEHKFPMHQETGLFYLLTLRSLLSKQAELSKQGTTYISTEFSEDSSLKTKKWASKMRK